MSFTTNDLLLAAQVRDLAADLRHSEWMRSGLPVSEKHDWHESQPLDPYIKEAIEDLMDVAALIGPIIERLSE